MTLPVNIGYHKDAVRWGIKGVKPSKFVRENQADTDRWKEIGKLVLLG